MNAKLSKLMWLCRDCVYPQLKARSQEEEERERHHSDKEQKSYAARIAALPNDKDVLVQYLAGCAKLLDEAERVRVSVEGRLTSTLGLWSIAGTIVFGSILAIAAGSLRVQAVPLRVLMALGALYLVLQICCAIFASIRGLERRGYIGMTISGVFRSPGEEYPVFIRRQIKEAADRLNDSRSHNDDKVSQMAVAHRAMKNFVVGLIVIAALGTCFAIRTKKTEADVVQTLRRNHDLSEMLRGPQGPQGPPGPRGEPGPPGPAFAPPKK